MHLWCQVGVRHGGFQAEAKVDVPSRLRRLVRRVHGHHHVGGDGDLVLHDYRSKYSDGMLMESLMMLVSVFGSVGAMRGGGCWLFACAEKPSPPPGLPRWRARHGTWMRLKTSRAC